MSSTLIPLFPNGADRSQGVPGNTPKTSNMRFFPSSVVKSLVGILDSEYERDVRSAGTTLYELSLAVAATVAPSNYQTYINKMKAVPPTDALKAERKKMIFSLYERLETIAEGTFADAAINDKFKAAYEVWITTPEGKANKHRIRQFNAGAEGVDEETGEEDPFLAMAAQISAAGRTARSTGRQAGQSAAQRLEGIKKLAKDKKSIPVSQLQAFIDDIE